MQIQKEACLHIDQYTHIQAYNYADIQTYKDMDLQVYQYTQTDTKSEINEQTNDTYITHTSIQKYICTHRIHRYTNIPTQK